MTAYMQPETPLGLSYFPLRSENTIYAPSGVHCGANLGGGFRCGRVGICPHRLPARPKRTPIFFPAQPERRHRHKDQHERKGYRKFVAVLESHRSDFQFFRGVAVVRCGCGYCSTEWDGLLRLYGQSLERPRPRRVAVGEDLRDCQSWQRF